MKVLHLKIIGKFIVVLFTCTALVLLGLYGLQHLPKKHDNRLPVVAGENPWGNIISQIGGSKVRVTSLINDPNVDPHNYTSNAQDALAVSQAKLVVANGLGYDDFLNKLMASSPNSQRSELVVANVLQVTGSNPNPHLWYDVPRVPEVAQAIEQALAQEPADAAVFAANLKKFDTSVQAVIDKVTELKTNFPGRPVAYTERVPGYLISEIGLTDKTPTGFAQAVEDGDDPSPANQAAMESLLDNKQIRVFFYNSQVISPITNAMHAEAEDNQIAIVGVTETIPAGQKDYQSWQYSQLSQLQLALEAR